MQGENNEAQRKACSQLSMKKNKKLDNVDMLDRH